MILFESSTLFLLTISIIYLFANYKTLVKLPNQSDDKIHNNELDIVNPINIIEKKAPNFFATSLKTGEKKSLEQIVEDDTVLIFVDTGCIHCNNNLEIFLNKVHNHSKINYVILIENSQINSAKKMLDLYDGNLNIYLTEYSTFDKYKIMFLPAFVLIDSKFTIKNITPIPILIFQNPISA
ncbi:hypothetical protein EKO25_06085 [Bacillus sp. SAJ1]|nr:hypothetical protein EKO25_06085 [Bacillus sp. SAJ1]